LCALSLGKGKMIALVNFLCLCVLAKIYIESVRLLALESTAAWADVFWVQWGGGGGGRAGQLAASRAYEAPPRNSGC
jgi:hypothetical protein